MTLIQISFVLLCLAQILHFFSHWLVLTRTMLDDRNQKNLTGHLDWSQPAYRTRPKKLTGLAKFFSR
jgi:hypothetical protein